MTPSTAALRHAPPKENAARPRILVVEDNHFVGLSIENVLTDAGYRVIGVVPTGEEALHTAAADPPDLVLMDIRLAAELDGIDTAIALRRRGLSCIFATAFVDEALKAVDTAAAPAGRLAKPFSPAEFLEAVKTALRKPGPFARAPMRPAGLEPATKPL